MSRTLTTTPPSLDIHAYIRPQITTYGSNTSTSFEKREREKRNGETCEIVGGRKVERDKAI